MRESDLDKVLNYMKQYVENEYEHDSEPMLNWKDLQLILNKMNELEKQNIDYGLEIERLNNIINELEKYIHNELILDFYDEDMPCELIINKMENMINKLKGDSSNEIVK